MSFQETKNEPRQDWQQTSTGVGHHHRPGYYFPNSDFKALIYDPVPPPLARQDEITRDQHFKTTYGDFHDTKYGKGVYGNPIHQKAPGHWKVNYVKDLAEKLDKGGWRKPLTMGNQLTETKEEFSNKAGVRQRYHFQDTAGLNLPQPYNLNDHHKEGPSKYGQGTTQNPKLQGQPFYVRDKGVLNLLDPYLSTTHKDHRSFKPNELKKYPKRVWPHTGNVRSTPKHGAMGSNTILFQKTMYHEKNYLWWTPHGSKPAPPYQAAQSPAASSPWGPQVPVR